MTERYLQSMASRRFVFGRSPTEMGDLFGHNPIIEVDLQCPVGQLVWVLRHFGHYAELFRRACRTVRGSHLGISAGARGPS